MLWSENGLEPPERRPAKQNRNRPAWITMKPRKTKQQHEAPINSLFFIILYFWFGIVFCPSSFHGPTLTISGLIDPHTMAGEHGKGVVIEPVELDLIFCFRFKSWISLDLPSRSLTNGGWETSLFPYWEGNFSGAMLNFRGVHIISIIIFNIHVILLDDKYPYYILLDYTKS